MGELFGTPAHPLLVHIPVVLLPLLAVTAIVMAAKPALRSRLTWLLFASTLVAAVVSILATRSGKRLRDALQPALGSKIDKHMDLGNQTAVLATIFFIGALCMVVMDRWYLPRAAKQSDSRSAVVLASVVALVGVVAAVWVIRTGHEGARITWDGINVP